MRGDLRFSGFLGFSGCLVGGQVGMISGCGLFSECVS